MLSLHATDASLTSAGRAHLFPFPCSSLSLSSDSRAPSILPPPPVFGSWRGARVRCVPGERFCLLPTVGHRQLSSYLAVTYLAAMHRQLVGWIPDVAGGTQVLAADTWPRHHRLARIRCHAGAPQPLPRAPPPCLTLSPHVFARWVLHELVGGQVNRASTAVGGRARNDEEREMTRMPCGWQGVRAQEAVALFKRFYQRENLRAPVPNPTGRLLPPPPHPPC